MQTPMRSILRDLALTTVLAPDVQRALIALEEAIDTQIATEDARCSTKPKRMQPRDAAMTDLAITALAAVTMKDVT